MNQNLTYSYTDPRVNQQNSQNSMHSSLQSLYPSTYQTTTYTTSTSGPNGYGAATFIPNNGTIVQQTRGPQTVRLSSTDEETKMSSMLQDGYFLEPSTSSNWNGQSTHAGAQSISLGSQMSSNVQYTNGQLLSTPGKTIQMPVSKGMATLSPDKTEKERIKKARQAEAARMRYHRLTPVQKRELNLKRTMAQKRKRQREKEMEELDSILRETNDIQEDPDITEQLREKRMRAKWAEAARQRYARMTPEERRAHNNRRRQRQMANALNAVKQAGGTGDPLKDEEAVRQHIKMQNAKKAEAARMRYHRMTDEEKRMYNQRRTEAFRRRRMEEELLLAMPIGRINGEALDRAQQIVVRNAKRAEAARARYQRMTPDQRKSYNQKRYTPKRRSGNGEMGGMPGSNKKEEMDVLTTLEREVMKRTQQALKRQQGAQAAQQQQQQQQQMAQSGSHTPGPMSQQQQPTYIVNPTPQHSNPHGVQIQLAQQNGSHQQIVHVSHHMQPIQTQGHTIVSQQGFNNQLPPSQGHGVVVQHSAPTSGQVVVHHPTAHQVTYTTTNGMMLAPHQVQPVQQQVLNPYQPRPQWMNHSVFLSSGVEDPNGAESPQHLETLTSSSGSSFQPLSSYPPTTTYYTTPATYFTSDLPTHHGLQPVRLPSISSSLSGVGDLTASIIKEHPAAVQADQMNSYMEYFVDQSDPNRSDEVVEEVVVDDHHIMDDEDEAGMLEDDGIIEGKFSYTIHEPHSSRSQPSYKRKKQLEQEHELDELLRQSNDLQTPEIQITLGGRNRVEATRQRRAEAARSRYQRMSESERKAYNQKRRLKALGIDPTGVMGQDDQTAITIKETIKLANAKKAEAARLRYHRMTPEEKREYNQRRTESFRKRREEEEILLSTPAGCISAESLKKAQQIMIRNARKAESARLRYQRMTPDQRKSLQDYNVRRAQSKKGRKTNGEEGQELDMSCSGSSVANDSLSDQASFGLGTSFNSEPSFEPVGDETPAPPPVPKDPTEEIFQQMEKEVMKKTKQAKAILDKQRTGQEIPAPAIRYPEPIIQQEHLVQDGGERAYVQNTNPLMIDEKALHDMLVTGRDANGLAVELRTIDGHKITQEAELNQLAQGQTIVIAPVDTIANESKDSLYVQTADGQIHLASSSGPGHDSYGTPRYRGEYVVQDQDPSLMSLSQKHEMAKAKRAERARIRYRNMQPELRQAQNARRADLLRKSRARDEELVTMAETRDVTGLSNDLQRAIHDAQERRRKRAEQARQKYHRMSSEERRQYNAMRDAQRRQRKRQQEMSKGGERLSGTPDPADLTQEMQPSGSNSISPSQEPLEENIIYNEFDIYDDPQPWEQ